MPWAELGVDLVLECTGAFRRKEDLEQHIRAGARYVILSAPAGGDEMPAVVHGVNAPDGSTKLLQIPRPEAIEGVKNGPFRSDGPAPRYGAEHATVSFRRLGAATPLAYNFARSEESPHVGPNGELRNHGKRTLGR